MTRIRTPKIVTRLLKSQKRPEACCLGLCEWARGTPQTLDTIARQKDWGFAAGLPGRLAFDVNGTGALRLHPIRGPKWQAPFQVAGQTGRPWQRAGDDTGG